jgi:phosphoglycolate phosphatase
MKICLFDIDGTLITTGGAGGRAMATAVVDEFGADPPRFDFPFGGRTDRSIVPDVFNAAGVEFTASNWQRFVKRYLLHLDRELSECDGHVYEGVLQVLDLVAAAAGVEVGLLTGNMEAAAWMKMDRFQLRDYFSFGGFGDRQAQRDDVAGEAAATVKERFGDSYDEIIVIGDTPADVQCGRAIGATVVAVATGSGSFEELLATSPDHLFHTMSDAHNYFVELANA